MFLAAHDHDSAARAHLLDANGIDTGHLARTLARVMTPRRDFADLYLQSRVGENWVLENGVVQRVSQSFDDGFGLRAVTGERTAFAYSEQIDADALGRAADVVVSMNDEGASACAPKRIGSARGDRDTSVHACYAPVDPTRDISARHKVDLLHRLEHYVRAFDPCIVGVYATLQISFERIAVMNTDERLAFDVRPLTMLYVRVVAARGGRTEAAAGGFGGRYGADRFDDDRLRALAERLGRSAVMKLEAGAAPSGELTVVLASGWPGILLHEAVGHGLEADFIHRRASVFSGRVGEQVTARGITIVDDGSMHEQRGSLNLDDEGTPTRETTLIEDGVLCGAMHDLKSARLMGCAPTGNGRRQSFSSLPMPRMTNTYMKSGQHDPQEIVESVKQGLFVQDLSDGQVDTVSGQFVFNASLAYLIENGRITRPVVGATLIGNGLETLRRVSMIGNDAALDPGVANCGKSGQSVPVCVGQPTLRVDGVTVGGTHAN
ncbi:metalloprotease TldD [Pararobbsia silviterrae]|uniref:Metalloprotease TldD n=1 Tax=Pararobbsia silviterrae TaxID=1792498 RepID=A0A494Y4Y9_9BURK|nr:metalloprotease TldD [Pararobbsia silviterrae]RKP57776.1 metalloprotease TldD [Pararobbsia silviterrae]